MSDSRTRTADIRQRMRLVRGRIPGELNEARTEVRQALDWKRHAGRHPYFLFGLAAGIGYLLVPRRKMVLRKVTLPRGQMPRHANLVTEDHAERTVAKASLASTLISTLTTFALRAGTSFATQQLLKRFQPPTPGPVPEFSRR